MLTREKKTRLFQGRHIGGGFNTEWHSYGKALRKKDSWRAHHGEEGAHQMGR